MDLKVQRARAPFENAHACGWICERLSAFYRVLSRGEQVKIARSAVAQVDGHRDTAAEVGRRGDDGRERPERGALSIVEGLGHGPAHDGRLPPRGTGRSTPAIRLQ